MRKILILTMADKEDSNVVPHEMQISDELLTNPSSRSSNLDY